MNNQGIIILGTAGDTITTGKQIRASGGIVIRSNNNQIILDPGTGTIVQMAKHNIHPRETTAIIISHQHINHTGDAAALISLMTHNGMDKRGVLISNEPPTTIPEEIISMTEKAIVLERERRIAINDIEIKSEPALHYRTKASGYLIILPEYTIGYTGDTKYYAELASQYKEANILIINTKHPNEHEEGDHLNTNNVIDILKEIKPELAIITHFGIKMINADPLAQARIIQRETGVQVIAAKDGMKITPSTYSIKRKQKTLKSF